MTITKNQDFPSLQRKIHEHYAKVGSQLGFFGVLDSGLAEEHIAETERIKKQLSIICDDFKVENSNEDSYKRQVVVPYFTEVLNSLIAKTKPAKAGEFRDTKETFELNMQSEALSITDLDNIVNFYHASVKDFLFLQKEVSGLEFHSTGTAKLPQYERKVVV